MKALVKYAPGPGNIEVREVPEPVIGPDEVLVEIRAAGLCGTDVEIAAGAFETAIPVILGHEGTGEVVAVGPAVEGVAPGDRVILETSRNTCRRCFYCRTGNYHLCPQRKGAGYAVDGVFAELAKAPADEVHRLPQGVAFDEAIIMEPTNTATRAVTEIARLKGGDTVLISGAGPIGLGVLQVVRACGAAQIIVSGRKNRRRLALAAELGASLVLGQDDEDPAEAVDRVTSGRGVDLFFECAGSVEALQKGLPLVRKRGQVVLVGLFRGPVELDLNLVLWRELVLRSVITSGVFTDWERTIALVEAGRIRLAPLVSDRFTLEDFPEILRRRREGSLIKGIFIL